MGIRVGSRVFVHGGFLYLKNKCTLGSTYYRCRTEGCNVMARVVDGTNLVTVNGVHFHDNAELQIQDLRLRQDLRAAAEHDRRDLRNVFNEVTARYGNI